MREKFTSELRKPSKGWKLLAAGAAILALSGTACSDNDPPSSGVAIPSDMNLENVEIYPEDARATINDRIGNRATTGAAQIIELVNRDTKSDQTYTNIVQDSEDASTFHVTYQYNFTPFFPDSVRNDSQFRVFMSLAKDTDGNLDPGTVSTIHIVREIPSDNSVWSERVTVSNDSGQWQMIREHALDSNSESLTQVYGGDSLPDSSYSAQNIERNLDQSFAPLLDEFITSAPS